MTMSIHYQEKQVCGIDLPGWHGDELRTPVGILWLNYINAGQDYTPDLAIVDRIKNFTRFMSPFEESLIQEIKVRLEKFSYRLKSPEEIIVVASLDQATKLVTLKAYIERLASLEEIITKYYYDGNFIDSQRASFISNNTYASMPGKYYGNIKFITQSDDITVEAIQDFERRAQLTLPESYRNFLLATNGGLPGLEGVDFDTGINFHSLQELIEINLENSDLKEFVAFGLVTIAEVGEGCGGFTNIYCKEGENHGKIFSWYWDTSDTPMPHESVDSVDNQAFFVNSCAAENFDEFIKKIIN